MNEAKMILWIQKKHGKKMVASPVAKILFGSESDNNRLNSDEEWFSMVDASYEDKGV
jgi:hypothetical protein